MKYPMESLQKRISRITGQLKGIQKMVEEERDSVAILQQVTAVKKAINGLTKEIILLQINKTLPEKDKKAIIALFERAIEL